MGEESGFGESHHRYLFWRRLSDRILVGFKGRAIEVRKNDTITF